jgi:hypothetical protein
MERRIERIECLRNFTGIGRDGLLRWDVPPPGRV